MVADSTHYAVDVENCKALCNASPICNFWMWHPKITKQAKPPRVELCFFYVQAAPLVRTGNQSDVTGPACCDDEPACSTPGDDIVPPTISATAVGPATDGTGELPHSRVAGGGGEIALMSLAFATLNSDNASTPVVAKLSTTTSPAAITAGPTFTPYNADSDGSGGPLTLSTNNTVNLLSAITIVIAALAIVIAFGVMVAGSDVSVGAWARRVSNKRGRSADDAGLVNPADDGGSPSDGVVLDVTDGSPNAQLQPLHSGSGSLPTSSTSWQMTHGADLSSSLPTVQTVPMAQFGETSFGVGAAVTWLEGQVDGQAVNLPEAEDSPQHLPHRHQQHQQHHLQHHLQQRHLHHRNQHLNQMQNLGAAQVAHQMDYPPGYLPNGPSSFGHTTQYAVNALYTTNPTVSTTPVTSGAASWMAPGSSLHGPGAPVITGGHPNTQPGAPFQMDVRGIAGELPGGTPHGLYVYTPQLLPQVASSSQPMAASFGFGNQNTMFNQGAPGVTVLEANAHAQAQAQAQQLQLQLQQQHLHTTVQLRESRLREQKLKEQLHQLSEQQLLAVRNNQQQQPMQPLATATAQADVNPRSALQAELESSSHASSPPAAATKVPPTRPKPEEIGLEPPASKKAKHASVATVSAEEWRTGVQGACRRAFDRLKLICDSSLRDGILERLSRGAGADDVASNPPCFLVNREDPTSRSPFQLQVMGSQSTNKRILAQKTIFAAYHNIPLAEMGNWQVQQRCTHSDGSWWCFEPSHLEKNSRVAMPNRDTKHPIPAPPMAIYIPRHRNPPKGPQLKSDTSGSISTSPESSEHGSPAPMDSEQAPALARSAAAAPTSTVGVAAAPALAARLASSGQVRHQPSPLLTGTTRTGVTGLSTLPASAIDPFAQAVLASLELQQQQHAFVDFQGSWDLPVVSAAELLTGAESTSFLLPEMAETAVARTATTTPSVVGPVSDDTGALLDVFSDSFA